MTGATRGFLKLLAGIAVAGTFGSMLFWPQVVTRVFEFFGL